MSPFRVRRERLADDALVVVRGDDLSIPFLRRDAVRAYRRFGEYAVSVLGASDGDALDALAAGVLIRFEVLTLMRVGTIRAAELEVRPTFRRPHYSIMLPDLDAEIIRLTRCENVSWSNPHYPAPE